MWFDSWSDVLRVVLVGAAAYSFLVLALRTSGKRTLTKLNAFDLVVTVAFGSTLATIFLSSEVAWVEGATALALLCALQYVVAKVTTWFPATRGGLTAGPTLVLRDGEPLLDAMRQQRLNLDELRQAVRSSGSGSLGEVAAIVLETDGTMSVIPSAKMGDGSALEGVPQVTG